ncbi:MAG: 30S ribosomal protein S5 [bacterium]
MQEESELKEKVIQIRRVTKVVRGGKKMGFRAAVVVGNLQGSVGVGIGKAAEVSAAIRKAVESAKKRQIQVPMVGTTVPHEITGKLGASSVVIRPAPTGTGVIAGGAVRAVLELAGIRNVVSKIIGSSNAINTAQAAVEGLSRLRTVDQEEELRGKKLDVILIGEEK